MYGLIVASALMFKRLILDGDAEEKRQDLKDDARVIITGEDYFRDAASDDEKTSARAEADRQISFMVETVQEVIKTLLGAPFKGLKALASALVETKTK